MRYQLQDRKISGGMYSYQMTVTNFEAVFEYYDEVSDDDDDRVHSLAEDDCVGDRVPGSTAGAVSSSSAPLPTADGEHDTSFGEGLEHASFEIMDETEAAGENANAGKAERSLGERRPLTAAEKRARAAAHEKISMWYRGVAKNFAVHTWAFISPYVEEQRLYPDGLNVRLAQAVFHRLNTPNAGLVENFTFDVFCPCLFTDWLLGVLHRLKILQLLSVSTP